MIPFEKNWILEELRPFQLNAEVNPIQRNICFATGTVFGDIVNTATGGAYYDMGGGDAAGDLADDLGLSNDDPLEQLEDYGDDGQLDDTGGDVLNEVVDEAGLGDDDSTVPSITYSKNGQLSEVSQVQSVPVIYGTRKIRGIKVYKELITEQSSTGVITDQDWYINYVLSEGEIEGLAGVICNSEYSSSSVAIYGSEFDITYNLHSGIESGEAVGYNPWHIIPNLQWPKTGGGVLSKLASIYIKLGAGELINAGRMNTALPKFSFIVNGKKVRTSTSSDTLSHSSNPVWCLRDYLTNSIYGVGLADSLLDDASFTAAATICDAVLGSSVATHSCNMIVNPAKPLMDNVKRILNTCGGSLLWVSGKYHVKIATTLVGDPAMTFDTSNIIGGISIKCESKTDKANQIIAKYITGVNHSDDQVKNWREAELTWPDKIDDSDLYTQFFETEDNSVPLRKTIKLKGVTDHNQVRYLAQQSCLQSRNNISVSFTSTAEALNLMPNDIISITHDTAGWTAKEFRVKNLTLHNNGTVSVNCNEYQSSTYTWSHQDIPAVTDDTNLPDPNAVSAPLNLAMTETSYSSIASGGKRVRTELTWTDNADYFNEGYEYQFQDVTSSASDPWIEAGTSVSSSGVMNDFETGTFDFRVRAINSVGLVSDWTYLNNQTIEGITTEPEDVTGLNVNNHGSNAVISWDEPTDSTDIDHIAIGVLQDDSTEWDDAEIIATVGTGTTTAVVPVIEGNYVAKWVGSGGLESIDYMDSGSITVYGSELVQTFAEQEAWAGTLSGLYETEDDGDDVLKFVGTEVWDNFGGLMDSWGHVDAMGGRATLASYTGVKRDLGAVLPARIYTNKVYTSIVTDGSNYMDTWTDIDGRSSWDQVEKLDKLVTQIRTTQDDPAAEDADWSNYKPFLISDVVARGLQLKVDFDQFSENEQFTLRELELLVDMVVRFESDRAKTATSITYDDEFYSIPDLVVTPINMATGDYMTISSEAKTGFNINFYNSSAVAQTRTYNYQARGY